MLTLNAAAVQVLHAAYKASYEDEIVKMPCETCLTLGAAGLKPVFWEVMEQSRAEPGVDGGQSPVTVLAHAHLPQPRLPLRLCGLQPARLLSPRASPDKDTGVGCHALLHGIFPTQGSNPYVLRDR